MSDNKLVEVNMSTGKVTPVEDTPGGKLWLTIRRGICPDCGAHGFYEGPSGGMSTNIFCSNVECRAGFNITPAVGTADRIHQASPDRYPKAAE